jgi:glycerol-3-phosphate dehydrogenase
VQRSEVVAAWAGLRPLIAEPGKAPHEISRRDEIMVGPARVITLAGGKLTGFRPMARAAIEKAAEVCGLVLAPVSADAAEPLPGGDFSGDLDAAAAELRREFELPAACADRLVRLYGSEARDVAGLGAAPLVAGTPVLASEVDWGVRVEGAASVEDVIYRRIRTALFVPDAREASVAPVAERMAALLGWSPARKQAEIDHAGARLAADLGFRG